jgi:hypothetical protein
MNIVKALEQIGLTGWTWRGNPEVQRIDPITINIGTPNERVLTQDEMDQQIINKIEWSITPPILTWDDLLTAESQSASNSQFDTELGYALGVSDEDQLAFTKLSSGFQLIGVSDDHQLEIKDINGQMHEVTFLQFKQIMTGYIQFCYNLWKK